MLDGTPGSISHSFRKDWVVVSSSEKPQNFKRSIITSNFTAIASTFDHVEETVHVYCNHPPDSAECGHVFFKGAADTIIQLPPHVGEGPFARIVSMEREYMHELPNWLVRKRDVEKNRNGLLPIFPCLKLANMFQ